MEGEAMNLKALLALPSVSLEEVCWGLSCTVLGGCWWALAVWWSACSFNKHMQGVSPGLWPCPGGDRRGQTPKAEDGKERLRGRVSSMVLTSLLGSPITRP